MVKNIKKLTKIQVQLVYLQLHKEFEEEIAHSDILLEKSEKLRKDWHSHYLSDTQLYQQDKKDNIEHQTVLNHKKIETFSQIFSCIDEILQSIEEK